MCVCKVKRERKNEKLYVCVSRYKLKREGKGGERGGGLHMYHNKRKKKKK